MTYGLSLAKLVDLAIGTPEVGSIDLTALHSLLHIIVRKLGCQKSHVELLPDHRERLDLLIETLEVDPSLNVTVEQREGNELFQVLPYDKNHGERKESIQSPVSGDDSQNISQRVQELESIVSILPSEEQLQQYHSSRESLKQDEPVDFLNMASRLDTIEISLGKLTALANDLLVEFSRLEKMVLPYLEGGDIAVMRIQIDNMNQLLTTQFPGFCSRRSSDPQRASRRLTINALPEDFYTKGVPTIAQITGPAARRANAASLTARSASSIAVSEQLGKEIECIKSVLNSLIGLLPLPDASGSELIISRSELSCNESQPAMRTNFHQKAASAIINLRSVQKEIDEIFLEKEERLIALETSQKNVVESNIKMQEVVDGISAHFEDIENKLDQVWNYFAESMDNWRNSLADQLEKLTEDVEYLKNDTVGRVIELEAQIEDRVDFTLFRTRVPMDQFETAVAMINQALKDGDNRLEICKNDLLQRFNALIIQLCEKSDRKELSAFEINVNRKLSLLQLRLNKFLKLQESIEAAGTKLKLSGNLKCISCDHEATMKVLDEVVPKSKFLRSKTYYPLEMDGASEARKNRYCGGLHTAASLRKSMKTNVQRLCEARELVNHIKKRSLDLGLNVVPPETPVYKIHL